MSYFALNHGKERKVKQDMVEFRLRISHLRLPLYSDLRLPVCTPLKATTVLPQDGINYS